MDVHHRKLQNPMNTQTQTKARMRSAYIAGIFTCVGATIAAVSCLGMVGLSLPFVKQFTNSPAGCSSLERLAVPFTGGYNAAYTQYSYQGKIFVTVSGTGQSSGTQYTDAFYLFTEGDGRSIMPEYPREWILTINGDPASDLIPNGEVPTYQSDHVYNFAIIVPDGILSFGVNDGFASDNTGSYTITLCQP
jgi:hypothetical protein